MVLRQRAAARGDGLRIVSKHRIVEGGCTTMDGRFPWYVAVKEAPGTVVIWAKTSEATERQARREGYSVIAVKPTPTEER